MSESTKKVQLCSEIEVSIGRSLKKAKGEKKENKLFMAFRGRQKNSSNNFLKLFVESFLETQRHTVDCTKKLHHLARELPDPPLA